MALTLTLSPSQAVLDAQVFSERAARVNNGSARLIAQGGFLQAYVGVLFPRGLLDQTPTVLGLRVFKLATAAEFDVVVPLESLIHRLGVASDSGEAEFTLPAEVASLAWAAITPPREGWRRRRGIASSALRDAAAEGGAKVAQAVAKVAQAVPESIGESVLQKVRAEIWGTALADNQQIPAGAAFAADALGFLTDKNMQVHTVGNWLRLTSGSGYVVVKKPGGAAES